MKKTNLILMFSFVLLLLVIPINVKGQNDYLFFNSGLNQETKFFNNSFDLLQTSEIPVYASFIGQTMIFEENNILYYCGRDKSNTNMFINIMNMSNGVSQPYFLTERETITQFCYNTIKKDDYLLTLINLNYWDGNNNNTLNTGLIKFDLINKNYTIIDLNISTPQITTQVGGLNLFTDDTFVLRTLNMMYEINYNDFSIVKNLTFGTNMNNRISSTFFKDELNDVLYIIGLGNNNIVKYNLTDFSLIGNQFLNPHSNSFLFNYNDLLIVGGSDRFTIYNLTTQTINQTIILSNVSGGNINNILIKDDFLYIQNFKGLFIYDLDFNLLNSYYLGNSDENLYAFFTDINFLPKLLNRINLNEDLILYSNDFVFTYDLNYFYENINDVKILFSGNEITKQNNYTSTLYDINITNNNEIILNYKGNNSNVFFLTFIISDINGYSEIFTNNFYYSVGIITIIEEGGLPKWLVGALTSVFIVTFFLIIIRFGFGDFKDKIFKK